MNLKIDFDSSLTDFEANCQAADAALDDKSNNVVPIIYSGLQLTSCLSFDFDIDSYCELHSTCLIYFANLRKALSDKSRFSKEKLNMAFEISLSCPFVLPRLYLALIVACTTKNKDQLKLMSEMLIAVSHPLRGLLLRFTAISFFPKCPELSDFLVDFAVNNFKEMMYLLGGFLKIYPKSKPLACQWLTSNTTISLFLSDNNPNIVKSFFDFAKLCKENYVSVAIVDSISQSIEGPQIPKYFELFADFFKTKAREEAARIKRNRMLQANQRGNVSNSQPNSPNNTVANQPKSPNKPLTPTGSSSSQNSVNIDTNPNNIPASQLPQNPYKSQLSPRRNTNPPSPPPPTTISSPPQQTQQQQPPPQQPNPQIQLNRPQPSPVAMPQMGRVALPPIRSMTSVAMPPIILPQQPQQPPKEQQLSENSENQPKKEEELENEKFPDSTDGEADTMTESSNVEEETNEEDENESSGKKDESSKTEAEGKIKMNQSFSDPHLSTDHKSVTEQAHQTPSTNQGATNEKEAQKSDTLTTVKPQIVTSVSSPLILQKPITQQPPQPSQQPSHHLQHSTAPSSPQKKQQQQQQQRGNQRQSRQRQTNPLYNSTKLIAIACLNKCENPREAFRFIQMTPFSESCGLHVTRLALRMNDIEVVKMCAERWPKYSVLHEILSTLGYRAYAEIVPDDLQGDLEITKEFVQKVTESNWSENDVTDAAALRKILSNELIDRSNELDICINELIITHNYLNELFYRTLFAAPFCFRDFLQISTVVSRYTSCFIPSAKDEDEKQKMKETVLGFIDRTKISIQNLIALRCGIYENGEKSDELVTKAIETINDSVVNFGEYNSSKQNIGANSNEVSFDSNLSLLNENKSSYSSLISNVQVPLDTKSKETASAARRILISHLQRLAVSDASLEILFNQCEAFCTGEGFLANSSAKNEVTSFILLAANKGNKSLAEKALITLLDMDKNTVKISDQITLYFEAINIIISITENENEGGNSDELISKETTKGILAQIVDTIKAVESFKKFFPIMTPVQSTYLVKIANIAKQKKYFVEFDDLFTNIIELMSNC